MADTLATAALNLTITESAIRNFKDALVAEAIEDHAIRVGSERLGTGKLHHFLDFAGPGDVHAHDIEVEREGVRFVVDPVSAKLLEGFTLDFVKSLQGQGYKFIKPQKSFDDPVAQRLQQFFDHEVNPQLASHGGYIELVDYVDAVAHVEMGGGCQGCGQAAATLREGVERQVKAAFPEIKDIIDRTDHAAGENPYYK